MEQNPAIVQQQHNSPRMPASEVVDLHVRQRLGMITQERMHVEKNNVRTESTGNIYTR